MQRSVILSFGIALLCVSCSYSPRSNTPSPGIPVTGNTALPLPTAAASASPTPEVAAVMPVRGSALFLDGQDDYVRVEDSPSLDLQNSFTIAAWIYLESYTGWASIVTKGDKPNINNYAIQQSEPFDPIYHTEFGRLRFTGCAVLPAPFPESGTALSLRAWHFVAITFDGLTIRFYTDGQPDGSSPVRGPLCTNNKPLYIGVDFPLATEYWHGAIDELHIWNVPLSDSQIRDMRNGAQGPLDTTLVGDWSFDEGSGSIAHDSSLYKNDGLLMGNPVWLTPKP